MNDPDEELTVLPALMNYRDTAAQAFVAPSLGAIAEAVAVRRRRRIGVVAIAAALVIGVVSAVAAAQLPRRAVPPPLIDPTPTRSASQSPSPSPVADPLPGSSPSAAKSAPLPSVGPGTIPLSAMLAPEDLGSGYRLDDRNETGGDWQLEFFMGQCPTAYDDVYKGPLGPRRGQRDRMLIGPKTVVQKVSVGHIEHAKWELENTRRWVGDCPTFTIDKEYTMKIISSGFAADDSLIVRVNDRHWVFVREGQWVTQFSLADHSYTLAQMQDLGRKAAARMG